MKPHIIIKLKARLPNRLPFWGTAVQERIRLAQAVLPMIDEVFEKYHIEFEVAAEFKPKSENWNQEEIAAGLDRIYRVIFKENRPIPDSFIAELSELQPIELVRKGNVEAIELPNKELHESMSFSRKYRKNGIHLSEAHLFSKGSPAVKIAVLDTGFETEHPELSHAMLPGKDFVDILNGAGKFIGDFLGLDETPEDEVGHGTHVAGIIAGKGQQMPIGVVPDCKIIPVKVLGALKRGNNTVGAGLVDNINNGIKWAVDQGANIINMSLGIKHAGGGLPHEEVIQYAHQKGVIVVAASGNDGRKDKYYPGALPGVIAVGAADDEGRIAPFSTYGGHVSLIAPGMNIYSCFLKGQYAISSGTSQAAPFVAGGIGLLKSYALSQGKNLNERQIKYLLKHTSDKIGPDFKDEKAGFGKLNLLDALKLMKYKLN